ncbi:hypothetical protein S7S_16130 [Isoalcanivorax pacificus W11-5]|uniref:Lipoprotein n=1 Tax=Isoalcanivorax pacificus W11-5 TaxID=391936 RepID=A0A0B4XT19_9GAMM|nr:hypothetical protein [Isoalcanivorax pacificus]AJD49638.1 hypothetical protein S7S_16130 [Isoalcanivorax pacificus W11-5]
MNRLIGMAVVAVLLSGCVSGAKLDGMVHRAPAAEYPVALVDAVEVGEVAGGKATNPLWMTEISNDAFNGALIASLAEQGLLGESGRYRLHAQLVAVDRPIAGLNMTSTTHVFYQLEDTRTGEKLLAETVTASHTARTSEAFMGATRLRLAIEGAARENIRLLLARLQQLDIRDAGLSVMPIQ